MGRTAALHCGQVPSGERMEKVLTTAAWHNAVAGLQKSQRGVMAAGDGYEERVRILIRLLHDGEKGFSDLGVRMKAPKHRSFYTEESGVRGAFARELERALRDATGSPVHENGTLLGPVHRAYLDARAALGANDCGLLGSTEMCERLTVRTYGEALVRDGMPEAVRTIVARQADHVRRAYRLVVLFRDEAQGVRGYPTSQDRDVGHP